ncbi:MAG TPA: aminodeoxychorismate synthase component I [Prolixibacteraceae bacterium]|nr:aminodeoxychorismate synthase component I [Prolixibacteraceae bacterium]
MKNAAEIKKQLNLLGNQGKPFVFLIDFEGTTGEIFDPNNTSQLLWQVPGKRFSNEMQPIPQLKKWEVFPVAFSTYKKGFNQIKHHILSGDTYLLNYTQPTQIECNLTLEEIYSISSAPYKVLLKNRFVCFSPECFIKIEAGKISSFPMKGTIDATIENAPERILKDSKETAEHNTIVDLIRNDLSRVAEKVTVEKFRYLERLNTNRKDLWQVSSKITGDLPSNYASKIGDILFKLLPAGSISGAPKKKTIEIIKQAEKYSRGFYTGIFGVFDGINLDSCVLIRFIEQQGDQLVYKSGGGITFMSDSKNEYDEMLKKVYVPVG